MTKREATARLIEAALEYFSEDAGFVSIEGRKLQALAATYRAATEDAPMSTDRLTSEEARVIAEAVEHVDRWGIRNTPLGMAVDALRASEKPWRVEGNALRRHGVAKLFVNCAEKDAEEVLASTCALLNRDEQERAR